MGDSELDVSSALAEFKKHFYDKGGAYPLQFILSTLGLEASPEAFSVIYQLEETGCLKRIYRIESSSLGGLKDFDSIVDIPSEIEDFRTGKILEVTPQNIRVLYVICSSKECWG